MIWFRENWYEELLRQLNEGLSLCQAAAFESRADGTLHVLNFMIMYMYKFEDFLSLS